MKKQELDHVLRAAGRITGEKQIVIIGSQSLHGKFPDLADDIVKSVAVDIVAAKHPRRTEWLNAIGVYSKSPLRPINSTRCRQIRRRTGAWASILLLELIDRWAGFSESQRRGVDRILEHPRADQLRRLKPSRLELQGVSLAYERLY